MIRTLDQMQKDHRRLNRMIDTSRSALRQDELKYLKLSRLRLKDRIAKLQRSAGTDTP